ncbi:MAG: sigma-70 family RNA polymerase sigma factor [Phycisphaerae bacterium]
MNNEQTQSSKVLAARASQAYSQQSREAMEEKWILEYLPLVRHIVNKIASQTRRGQDFEDLISAGTLGLVKAARSFDPNREAEFKTYAYIRVRGAVLDELRGRSFVPSAVHGQIRKVKTAYQTHIAQHGVPPSDEDLAECMEMSLEQLYKIFEEARKQKFLSIHGIDDEQGPISAFVPPTAEAGPQEKAERHEMLANLTEAIQDLPQRDRIVLLLYYDRDLTMKEAAQVLGVTESRVSQLHAAAVFKLSMKLKKGAQ